MSPSIDIIYTPLCVLKNDAECQISYEKEEINSIDQSYFPMTEIAKDKFPRCNEIQLYVPKKRRKSKLQDMNRIQANFILSSMNEVKSKIPEHICEKFLSAALRALRIDTDVKFIHYVPEDNNLSSVFIPDSEDRLQIDHFDEDKVLSKPLNSSFSCVSCGMIFLSVEKLTEHLINHVFEGYQAAIWLSNAMNTLLPALPTQESDQSQVMTSSISSDLRNDMEGS